MSVFLWRGDYANRPTVQHCGDHTFPKNSLPLDASYNSTEPAPCGRTCPRLFWQLQVAELAQFVRRLRQAVAIGPLPPVSRGGQTGCGSCRISANARRHKSGIESRVFVIQARGPYFNTLAMLCSKWPVS